jgi:adenosine deaminase
VAKGGLPQTPQTPQIPANHPFCKNFDPGTAGLAEEYRQLRDTFGYSDAVIADVARAGVRASFAPADVKAQLLAQIGAWLG